MDKLQKLIEEAEAAEKGLWRACEDSLFDSERWNAQVVVSDGKQIVSRICECEASEAHHIANTQPSKILPILKAFQKMQQCLSSACCCAASFECHACKIIREVSEAIDNL